MYSVTTNHSIITINEDSLIIKPKDNNVAPLEVYLLTDYKFDTIGFKGIIDRTHELNGIYKPEVCIFANKKYKDVVLEIKELPSNRNITITIYQKFKGKDMAIYTFNDTIIKGGKYDED